MTATNDALDWEEQDRRDLQELLDEWNEFKSRWLRRLSFGLFPRKPTDEQ